MKFVSKWITTKEFECLKPINVFHKERDDIQIAESPIKNYHVHFRKKFYIETTENVVMNISADDYYKLYINGDFVCQGPAPAYPECYQYNQVDISSFLKCGENMIAVHVYYQGLINRVWVSGDNRQGLIVDIFQNDRIICGTDESWSYFVAKEFDGELIGYKTAFLENIDFNLEEKGWKLIDFDDTHYEQVIVKNEMDYSFLDEPVKTLDVYQKLPEKVVKIDKGKYFIDFGEELTGQFSMSIKGKQNQKVIIRCGEERETDDSYFVRYDMRCNCHYEEVCTLSGELDELDFFDYKAFRYVNVFTNEDNVDANTFCAIVRHHKFEKKLFLTTNLPYIKDIWKLCSNSLKYGAQEALLDCPTREKGLYLGDFTVSGLAYLYLTNDIEYYKKILFDFASTVKVCKGILGVANCSFMQEIADFSLQYPLQVLNYYEYTKDIDTVKKLYPVVCGIIEYFSQFKRDDGLLENVYDKWNLVDWPENLRDDYCLNKTRDELEKDCHNVINAFYIGAVKALNRLAKVVGEKEVYCVESLNKAYVKSFYDEKTKLFYDNEERLHSALHSNVLPLLFDIAPVEANDTIKKFIMSKGLCCGVQFSYFVLKALGKIGAYEEELALLMNDSEHSWVNMLREGATTCFEAWGKEQKWNTSLCHPWACAPIIILFEDLNNKFGIKIKKG